MISSFPPERLVATRSAKGLLKKLQEENGPLILYPTKGCFDRTDLACFPQREFLPSSGELRIGEISGASFYIREADLAYLGHRQLVVDAGPGSGGLFAMERRLGVRFFTRLRKVPRPGA